MPARTTTMAGAGVVKGAQVDPWGVGQGIGDFTGRVGGALRGGGLHLMAAGQVLAGVLVVGAGVALMAWLFMTRTDSGRSITAGAARSAQAAATIAAAVPK